MLAQRGEERSRTFVLWPTPRDSQEPLFTRVRGREILGSSQLALCVAPAQHLWAPLEIGCFRVLSRLPSLPHNTHRTLRTAWLLDALDRGDAPCASMLVMMYALHNTGRR